MTKYWIFDKLRIEIRKIEQDHLKTNCTTAPCKPVVDNTSDKSEIKQMKNMIQSLSETLKNLEYKINTPQDLHIKTGLACRGSSIGFHLLWHTVELAMSTRLCLL